MKSNYMDRTDAGGDSSKVINERWHVSGDSRPGMEWNRHIMRDKNTAVCFMAHSAGRTPEGDAARAKLIAAAPALAEALQALITSLADADEEGLIEHAEQMVAARAALAAAGADK